AEQSRAEQSRAEQSRAEQSRAEQSSNLNSAFLSTLKLNHSHNKQADILLLPKQKLSACFCVQKAIFEKYIDCNIHISCQKIILNFSNKNSGIKIPNHIQKRRTNNV
ncbi:MAG: hypothetical protein FWG63_00495, partial [Defluviitaleaceae bacterium]|nr:hypothetical protein [Defluviitaleaceae bacterium]